MGAKQKGTLIWQELWIDEHGKVMKSKTRTPRAPG